MGRLVKFLTRRPASRACLRVKLGRGQYGRRAPRALLTHKCGCQCFRTNFRKQTAHAAHTAGTPQHDTRARSVAPPVESWPKHTGSLPPVEFFQMETQRPLENCRQGRSMKSLRFANCPDSQRPLQCWATACVQKSMSAVNNIEGRHASQAHVCA